LSLSFYREGTDSKALFTGLGYDPDNCMVVQLDGVFHHGADAINTIASAIYAK